MRRSLPLVFGSLALLFATGCGRQAIVASNLPLKRVVVYRNGIAYFERGGRIDDEEVRFKMKEGQVGDFLATLAVMEQGGSSVRSAAFPLEDDEEDARTPPPKPPEGGPQPVDDEADAQKRSDRKKGLRTVVLQLDGKEHDLEVGYVAESPVWRPSYRLVVGQGGDAQLQAWGIVQNLSGEDWKDVRLSLVAGAPLAFEAQLGTPVIPGRPVVSDSGEVIAAVPGSETSLEQSKEQAPAPPPPPAAEPAAVAESEDDDDEDGRANAPRRKAADARTRTPSGGLGLSGVGQGGGGVGEGGYGRLARPSGAVAAAQAPKPMPAAGEKTRGDVVRREMQQSMQPRSVRSLAAIAAQGGATRYDIPVTVTVPDKSATMVMLLSQKVPGEAIFLFAPDGGVPDSASHPFRVARFKNVTTGALERGPIAVFDQGAFLGQGMVDPLPVGATTTVPFALERSVAVEQERKYDELGARIAKIENAELTIERDGVTKTTYRVRNGSDKPAKILVKHPRVSGARLYEPPKDTEDNVGTGSALVPGLVAPKATAELVVDERQTLRRWADWFSVIADNAVKAYVADPRSDRTIVQKLGAAWVLRDEIVALSEGRGKLVQEQSNLSQQTEETRRNLKAIEKNATAAQLRDRLTKRLAENALRLDEITKRLVETDAKLAELRIRFKEAIREIKLETPPPPKP
jgi:hypothetical protein